MKCLVLLVAIALAVPALARGQSTTTDTVAIRNHAQVLHLYGNRGNPPVILASGDGGWLHVGPQVAEFLALQGNFVVGFDSKAYLAGFTRGSVTLSPSDVPGDFKALVDYAAKGATAKPLLMGVSEGAGLAVLAAADPAVKAATSGVVALGLPDKNELGWRFRDSTIYLTKGLPDEPLFSVAEVIAKVSPLPIVAIHSTRDEFVPLDEVRRLMDRALEPKRLVIVEARNHGFGGNEADMHARLVESLAWIRSRRD
jgi:dienelactone hydrolase